MKNNTATAPPPHPRSHAPVARSSLTASCHHPCPAARRRPVLLKSAPSLVNHTPRHPSKPPITSLSGDGEPTLVHPYEFLLVPLPSL
jgi:hypothetical protein